MADYLIKASELATWTGNDAATVATDPLAKEVMDKVSQLARFKAGQPDWTLDAGLDQIPFDARMVVLQVCKRTYENPRQVVQEGNIGPIGGDRVLDAAALLMELTEYENAVLVKYNPEGDPTPLEGGQVFTLTMMEDEVSTPGSALYMGDNQQINLSSSADPREWMIPMFNPADPGDDSLYDQ